MSWHSYYQNSIKNASSPEEAVGYASRKSFALAHRIVKEVLGSTSGSDILDVGCGHGMMSGWLSEKNTVIGADFVMDMLKHAQRKKLVPVQADAAKLPFKRNSFDLVMSVEVIQLVESGVDFIKHLSGFVKKGGRILITGLNSHSVIRNAFRKAESLIKRNYREKPRTNLWDASLLASLLEKEGFRVEIFYTCFPLPNVIHDTGGVFKRHAFASNFFILGQKL